MPKFKFDEVVKCTIDGLIFPVRTVTKISGGYLYLRGNIWIPEKFIESTECMTNNFETQNTVLKQSPETLKRPLESKSTGKKLFAYQNVRTSKVDHYQWEWTGNQFSKRAPQFDIEKAH